MYHSISYCENPLFRRFTVTPERFEEQLDYLSTHGYTPLTVSDYSQRVAGEDQGQLQGQLPPRPVVLTFDDGYADFYADFYTAALPLLLLWKYQATATLYIVTGYLGETSRWLQCEGEAWRQPMCACDMQPGSACARAARCCIVLYEGSDGRSNESG
jgi:peptidoglycan/xylan/chitin deacetylase (PgdA/CDA1 family)